jgi:hypothetical protein
MIGKGGRRGGSVAGKAKLSSDTASDGECRCRKPFALLDKPAVAPRDLLHSSSSRGRFTLGANASGWGETVE